MAPEPAPRSAARASRQPAAAAEGPAQPPVTSRAAPAEPAPAPLPARGGDRSRAATVSSPTSRRVSPASRASAAPPGDDALAANPPRPAAPVTVTLSPDAAMLGPVKVSLMAAGGAVVEPPRKPAAAAPAAPTAPTPPSMPRPDSRGAAADGEGTDTPPATTDAEAGPLPVSDGEEAAPEPLAAAAAPPAPTTTTADAAPVPAGVPHIDHTAPPAPALPGAVAVHPVPASECAAPASVRVPVWTPSAGPDHGTRYVALSQVADVAGLSVDTLAELADSAAPVALAAPALPTGGVLLKPASLTKLARQLASAQSAALARAVDGVWSTNPVLAAAAVPERAAARVARVRTAT